ncbi:SURP and G-patch domain-containing protein 1 [Pseudolycoriella hygida]|uniref:SURP and G-patch domain-containing protein 1 n=1 Tax=Pseudolycoriella hygida TaxID=35572 RepID=A0A9Q0NEQ5_9DIPT|nr:SURP and G-patch domain-containing protein 1 [Pseudolycoriella hygida]
MSRRNMTTRIDRVAQMSMQEEIIAKRKLELLEKQKTVELAKQVQAAQTGGKATKKEAKSTNIQKQNAVSQEPAPPKNNFSNDGSFFENFKKITDAAKKKAQEVAIATTENPTPADSTNIADSIIAELIQAPPPPPPLPEPEKALPPPPALPVLIDDQKMLPNESSSLPDKEKKSESRTRDIQKSESDSIDKNQFSSQPTTNDSSRRDTKYSNQDHRMKKTTTRFSNPPTSKIPSLLDLPSENPFTKSDLPNSSNDSFFHNDDNMPSNNSKGSTNRFSQNQSNRFGNEQGSQNSKFSDSTNFSKDSSFGYRFGEKSNWSKSDQSNNRFADESPFANQFGGRDNFSNDNQKRFMNQNNSSRFSHDQFPCNSTQFTRFVQEPTRSGSNSQESFTLGQSAGKTDTPNPFPKDQDDRILPNAQFPNRFIQDATNNFVNAFGQNPASKLKSDDVVSTFPGMDVNVTPNNFMMTTAPPTEQRNLFPNQPMNRFVNASNQEGFGRTTPRFDDFPNSFHRTTFNAPPINQPANFITPQPNLQQPPPNFQSNNQQSNVISPFNSSAFGLNFTSPPPVNPLLHTIPQPLPMSLNKIPHPKDLDLNAIPEPQAHLGASNFAKSTDNDFIPTSVDALVALVAENDEYEDKLCSRKIELHSSLWFLSEKNSLAYRNYRQKVKELRTKLETNENDKYDPLEIDYKDDDIDDPPPYDANQSQSNDYDNDSDSEYMMDSKARNLKSMKRKLDSDSRDFYSSDSDDHERYHERFCEIDEKPFKAEKDSEPDVQTHKSNRKSRWGDRVDVATTSTPQPLMSLSLLTMPTFASQQKPLLTSVKRTDPALLNYARQNYGTVDLNEEDWKKCEDHFKVNLLYQDMLKKREEIDRMARSGRFKYEYDSDEDVDGGTWEHKMRSSEMEATSRWAEALNKQAEGKHHLQHFLPPEELKKFMEKYDSKLNNCEPDISDYKEYKLKEDNIGFQMLQKLGWKQGEGLRPDGIVDPVNKAQPRDSNQGLGVLQSSEIESSDNEYDAYRKRMMLAYRFRPNPLNNPRRAYY